ADRGLPPRTRALQHHVHLANPVFHRTPRRRLGGELRGERRALARALEPDVAGARPRQGVPGLIRERDDRVVERRLDVRNAVRDVPALFALRAPSGRTRFCHFVLRLRCSVLAGLLLPGDRLLRALPGTRVRARALPVNREAPAVPESLVAADLHLALDVLAD